MRLTFNNYSFYTNINKADSGRCIRAQDTLNDITIFASAADHTQRDNERKADLCRSFGMHMQVLWTDEGFNKVEHACGPDVLMPHLLI